MRKIITLFTFILISTHGFAATTTQYPGNEAETTATQIDTRQPIFYTPEKPLNKEAAEANQTIKDNSQ